MQLHLSEYRDMCSSIVKCFTKPTMVHTHGSQCDAVYLSEVFYPQWYTHMDHNVMQYTSVKYFTHNGTHTWITMWCCIPQWSVLPTMVYTHGSQCDAVYLSEVFYPQWYIHMDHNVMLYTSVKCFTHKCTHIDHKRWWCTSVKCFTYNGTYIWITMWCSIPQLGLNVVISVRSCTLNRHNKESMFEMMELRVDVSCTETGFV